MATFWPTLVPTSTTHGYNPIDNSFFDSRVVFGPIEAPRLQAKPLFQSHYAFGARPNPSDENTYTIKVVDWPVPRPEELVSTGKCVLFAEQASSNLGWMLAFMPAKANYSDEYFDAELKERIVSFAERSTHDKTFTSFVLSLAVLCTRDLRMRSGHSHILERSAQEFNQIGQTPLAAILMELAVINTSSILAEVMEQRAQISLGYSELGGTKAFFNGEIARLSNLTALMWHKVAGAAESSEEAMFALSRAVYFGYLGRNACPEFYSSMLHLYAHKSLESAVTEKDIRHSFNAYLSSVFCLTEKGMSLNSNWTQLMYRLNTAAQIASANSLLSGEMEIEFASFVEKAARFEYLAGRRNNIDTRKEKK